MSLEDEFFANSKIHPSDYEFEEKLIFNFFFQCDLNLDGKITQEEFLKAGLSIAELFEFESDE